MSVSHSELLREVEAERDAAIAKAAGMHSDLQSAMGTLQYMEHLLRALKLQKKANASVEERLKLSTDEAVELRQGLSWTQTQYEASMAAIGQRDNIITQLEERALELVVLQSSHSQLVVRHMVADAISHVKTRVLKEHERSIAGLKKGVRVALGKLDKAREDAATLRKELDVRLEVYETLRGAKEAVGKELMAQKRVGVELKDAVEKLSSQVQAERKHVAELQEERRRAEELHQQSCAEMEAGATKAADRCLFTACTAEKLVRVPTHDRILALHGNPNKCRHLTAEMLRKIYFCNA